MTGGHGFSIQQLMKLYEKSVARGEEFTVSQVGSGALYAASAHVQMRTG